MTTPEGIEVLAGNRVPEGSEPLAMAYAGFQFGNWVPQLGDGRAILLGELIDRMAYVAISSSRVRALHPSLAEEMGVPEWDRCCASTS